MEKEEGLSMRNHSLQACGNSPRPVYQEQQEEPGLGPQHYSEDPSQQLLQKRETQSEKSGTRHLES